MNEIFYCKHLKKTMLDSGCKICRLNGNELRKRYEFSTKYSSHKHCREDNGTDDIPPEASIFVPVDSYLIEEKKKK